MYTSRHSGRGLFFRYLGLLFFLCIQVRAVAQVADTTSPIAPDKVRTHVYPDRIDIQWEKSADETEVPTYQVLRNGAPVATVMTLLYNDREVAPNTTYTYAVKAIDGAGRVSASSLSVSATSQAASPAPPSTQIVLPVRQWVALPMPPRGAIPGVSKHVTGALNPEDGRIYFTGGDYEGPLYTGSYRQETYSLSIAARWADKSDPHAGWRLDYPYCGPTGQVQPQGPDFVGWTWDAKRRVFWLMPGLSVRAPKTCHNMTGEKNDPQFPFARIMTFDPVAKRWTDVAAGGRGAGHVWQSVHDPVTDTIVQLGVAGSGMVSVGTYHLAKATWTYKNVAPPDWDRQMLRLNLGYVAADLQARVIYAIAPTTQRLYRYGMDSQTLEDLGPLPVPNHERQTKIVWDSINGVLLWHNGQVDEFFAYHPGTQNWEPLSTQSDLPNIHAVANNTMVFDPRQNALLIFGEVWSKPGTPKHAAKPYMFLYRYGSGSGPVGTSSLAK